MYDMIIVGGGAAGLSAGMYALSKQLSFVLIYEDLGGKQPGDSNLNRMMMKNTVQVAKPCVILCNS